MKKQLGRLGRVMGCYITKKKQLNSEGGGGRGRKWDHAIRARCLGKWWVCACMDPKFRVDNVTPE